MNFERIQEQIAEHKISIAMFACGTIALINLASGGGSKLTQRFQNNATDAAILESQRRAERLAFNDAGELNCTMQFVNQATGKTGLAPGAIAIDPLTRTPFTGGKTLLCTPNGDVWTVADGGKVSFQGNSPKVRKTLVAAGAVAASRDMLNAK